MPCLFSWPNFSKRYGGGLRKAVTILFFMLHIPLLPAGISYNAENGLIPRSLKSNIDMLYSEVDSYFSRTRINSFDIEIIFSDHLTPGWIRISPGVKAIRIYISNSPEALSFQYVKMRMVSVMVVNRVCPDLILKNDRLPDWISCGFLFRSWGTMKGRYIKLSKYPTVNALYNSGWQIDYRSFLEKGSALNGNSSAILMGELGAIILKNVSGKGQYFEFVDRLKAYLSLDKSDGEFTADDSALLKSKCLPNGTERILMLGALNYFYPLAPEICRRDMSAIVLDLIAFQENPQAEHVEISSKVSDSIKKLNDIKLRIPYRSQSGFDEFMSELNWISRNAEYDKLKRLVEADRLAKIFDLDIDAYRNLSEAERRYVPVGTRYSSILDYLAVVEPSLVKEKLER